MSPGAAVVFLAVKKRVEMGVFGPAARVRAKVRELDGVPRQPKLARRNELDNVKGELADMREELTAARSENPFAYWRESPGKVARILARADRQSGGAVEGAGRGAVGRRMKKAAQKLRFRSRSAEK